MKNKIFKSNPDLQFIRNDIKGNLFIDGKYVLKEEKDKQPLGKFLKWISSKNPQKTEKKQDTFIPELIKNDTFTHSSIDKIVWLGHSSFYIQINKVRILTDPVFYSLTPLLKRKHKLPCTIDEIKNIDYILLSHGHRDHLDVSSLRKILLYNPTVEILCPLGFKKMLASIGFKKIQEAAWWQQYIVNKLDITFLPAKHWNRRFITDYNKTLWGSFAIKSKNTSLYFAGDTGFDAHFEEIHKYFSSFDICLMPVGAYKPRYIMKWAHVSPEEAVHAFNILHGKIFIPMHYGTFDLSDEPASEPVKILKHLERENEINGDLEILAVGEEFYIKH